MGMELRLKRNYNIVVGRETAYSLIESRIKEEGGDGAPILIRYKDEEGSTKIKTIIVVIAPDGNYSTYEDTETILDLVGDGKTIVTSSDESVHVTPISGGYDLSILNKEIIDYLYDLVNYHYNYGVSFSNITIDITSSSSGSGSATLSSSRYRGLDNPTYTKDNPERIDVTDSSSTSVGWVKASPNKWTYSYTVTDKSKNSDSIPFTASVTNSDGQTSNVSGNLSVTLNKYWMIIEHDEKVPTAAELDAYFTMPSNACLYGVGPKRDKQTTWDQKKTGYFWVLCPSNKSVTATQLGQTVVKDAVDVVGTMYGTYKAYCSLSEQAGGTRPEPDVVVQ